MSTVTTSEISAKFSNLKNTLQDNLTNSINHTASIINKNNHDTKLDLKLSSKTVKTTLRSLWSITFVSTLLLNIIQFLCRNKECAVLNGSLWIQFTQQVIGSFLLVSIFVISWFITNTKSSFYPILLILALFSLQQKNLGLLSLILLISCIYTVIQYAELHGTIVIYVVAILAMFIPIIFFINSFPSKNARQIEKDKKQKEKSAKISNSKKQ